MIDPELQIKLDEQKQKLDAIYVSVEKTRKYFLWTLVATLVTFVLPLIAVIAIIPWFLSTMLKSYSL